MYSMGGGDRCDRSWVRGEKEISERGEGVR